MIQFFFTFELLRSVRAVREMRGNLELARRKELRSNSSNSMDNSSFNMSLANQSLRIPTGDKEYLLGTTSYLLGYQYFLQNFDYKIGRFRRRIDTGTYQESNPGHE